MIQYVLKEIIVYLIKNNKFMNIKYKKVKFVLTNPYNVQNHYLALEHIQIIMIISAKWMHANNLIYIQINTMKIIDIVSKIVMIIF